MIVREHTAFVVAVTDGNRELALTERGHFQPLSDPSVRRFETRAAAEGVRTVWCPATPGARVIRLTVREAA